MNVLDDFMVGIGEDEHTLEVRKSYPYIVWVNAILPNPKVGFAGTGGFFFERSKIPSNFTLENREMETVSFPGGGTGDGYTFMGLHLVPIAHRLDWFYRDQAVRGGKKFCNSYNEAMAEAKKRYSDKELGGKVGGRTQYLALVRELAPWYGPVVITASGRVGAMMQKDCVETFLRDVVGRAAAISGRKSLPPYALWIPIRSSGVREKAGGNQTAMITPPILVLPTWKDQDEFTAWIKAEYVGSKVLELARESWDAGQEWARATVAGGFGDPQLGTESEDSAGTQAPDAGFQRPYQSPSGEVPWANQW